MHSMVSEADVDSAVCERDFAYLRDLIRDKRLSPEIREYLAHVVFDLLTGKTKRPAHRPAKEATRRNGLEIAMRVFELREKGWLVNPEIRLNREAAVKQAASEFRCSDRKVYDYLKQFNEYVRHQEDAEDRFKRQCFRGVWTDKEMKRAKAEFEHWVVTHPDPSHEEIEAADFFIDWFEDFARGRWRTCKELLPSVQPNEIASST